MPEYDIDRKWSDQYIPLIKRLVGPYLLEESNLQVDQKEATDLIVMSVGRQQIACRVRRPKYWPRYASQFTIRARRKSGAKTELRKIIEGFCDLMFYGFALDGAQIGFSEWYLINLRHWRSHLIFSREVIKRGTTQNPDGETSFEWFEIRSFPPEPPLLEASDRPGQQTARKAESSNPRCGHCDNWLPDDCTCGHLGRESQKHFADFGVQNAGY